MKAPFSPPVALGALGLALPGHAPFAVAGTPVAGTPVADTPVVDTLGEAVRHAIKAHPEASAPATAARVTHPSGKKDTAQRLAARLTATDLDSYMVTGGERRNAVSAGVYRRHIHADQATGRLCALGLNPEPLSKPLP